MCQAQKWKLFLYLGWSNQEPAENTIVGRGRGRAFPQSGGAQTGGGGPSWNQQRQAGRQQRSASDTDFDWRKNSGDASPNNNEDSWSNQPNQVFNPWAFTGP